MVRKKINMLLVVGMAMSSVAPVVATPTKERVSRGSEQPEIKEEFQNSFQTRWERVAKGPQTLYNAWQKQNMQEAAEGLVGCFAYALGLYATYRLGSSFMGGTNAQSNSANPVNPANKATNSANPPDSVNQPNPANPVNPANQPCPANPVNPVDAPVAPVAEGGNVHDPLVPVNLAAQAQAEEHRQNCDDIMAMLQATAQYEQQQVQAADEQRRQEAAVEEHRQNCDDIVAMLQATAQYEQQRQEELAAAPSFIATASNGLASVYQGVASGLGTAVDTTPAQAGNAARRAAQNGAAYVADRMVNGRAYNEGLPYLRRRAADAITTAINTTPRQATRATAAGLGYAGNKVVDGVRWSADTPAGHATRAVALATVNRANYLALNTLAYGVVLPAMAAAQVGYGTVTVAAAVGEVCATAMGRWGLGAYRYFRPGVPEEAEQDAGRANIVEADVLAPEHVAWLEDQRELCRIDGDSEIEASFRADLSSEENRALRMTDKTSAAAVNNGAVREIRQAVRHENVGAGVTGEERSDFVDEDVAGPASMDNVAAVAPAGAAPENPEQLNNASGIGQNAANYLAGAGNLAAGVKQKAMVCLAAAGNVATNAKQKASQKAALCKVVTAGVAVGVKQRAGVCLAGMGNAAAPHLRQLILKYEALADDKKAFIKIVCWVSPLMAYQFLTWLSTSNVPSDSTSLLTLLPTHAIAKALAVAAELALIKRALADQGAHNEGARYIVGAGDGSYIDFPGFPTVGGNALTMEMMDAGAAELYYDALDYCPANASYMSNASQVNDDGNIGL